MGEVDFKTRFVQAHVSAIMQGRPVLHAAAQ
jgi:hypothetical protein